MPSVLIAGGGHAGLAAAAALGGGGFDVDLFEARPFLGGRATSYPIPGANEDSAETIDNCQHLLLRCCVNLLDFYQRAGVRDRIRFYGEVYFLEPGGRFSVVRRASLPAPFHFTGSFLRMRCLDRAEKFGIARALLAIRRERTRRADLDRISMLDWLLQKRQTPRADGYEMGIPTVPLAQLYAADAWQRLANVRFHLRSPVERIDSSGFTVAGERRTAGHYIRRAVAQGRRAHRRNLGGFGTEPWLRGSRLRWSG